MKIVFATGNSGKLREAQEILGEGFMLVTPAQMGLHEDIPETGNTLRANSLIKAQHIFDRLGCNCFADDTGLETEILGGGPGVHTARYAGEGKDFDDNMDKLLSEMSFLLYEASVAREYGINMVHATRKARFRTVVTLILDGEKYFFDGTMEGSIALEKIGTGGFGYDPVFIPDFLPGTGPDGLPSGELRPNTDKLTAAQLTDEQKNMISHRGIALRAMADFLKGR